MDVMNFLFASDSFKGSLSSDKINKILCETAEKIFPDSRCKGVFMADGGEGTVQAIMAETGGELRTVTVKNPLFEDITATYGCIGKTAAVIEMATASGLPLIPQRKRNPLYTTSYGTGQLIADALDHGIADITIALGGSATNDGGMGAMTALGVRFLDKDGIALSGTGENLERVWDIDLSNMHPGVKNTKFTIMCDVNNPLIGPDGATLTFGAQKGGDSAALPRLEAGMTHYAEVLKKCLGSDAAGLPGAGAAGGLGAAFLAFLNGKLKSGIETVLDLIHFDDLLKKADFVITGEGRMDWQSVCGKVPYGVGMRCRAAGVPAAAIVGGMGTGAEKIYACGVCSVMPITNGPMGLDEAVECAEELYRDAAERLFRLLKAGMDIQEVKCSFHPH